MESAVTAAPAFCVVQETVIDDPIDAEAGAATFDTTRSACWARRAPAATITDNRMRMSWRERSMAISFDDWAPEKLLRCQLTGQVGITAATAKFKKISPECQEIRAHPLKPNL